MSDFYESWALSRGRFVSELEGLTLEQLSWRIHPNALTIAEGALHVAGVEVKFGEALMGVEADPELDRIRASATEGVVNANPFPFTAEEMTPEFVAEALAKSKTLVEPALRDATAERREVSMVSALGPIISGEGAMARLGFHAAYHQGQTYLIKTSPEFPA